MLSASKTLQQWCAAKCAGYPGVLITDLCSSFRDGLAFCALIHRHRPDLIDYDALSKENVFENNRLAFEVAERELGIPALLDPEDMVSMKIPDRLSIMTYVSQYYNLFRNSSPAAVPQFKQPTLIVQAQNLQAQGSLSTTATRVELSSMCALCQKHVHLVQRCLVDGKLYHRQCFRCKECSSTLLPGSYRPGPETGTFVCTHHHRPCPVASRPESVDENSLQNKVQTPPKLRTPPKPPLPNKPQKEPETDVMTDERPVPAPRKTNDGMPQPLPRVRSGAGQSPSRPRSLMNGEQQISDPPVPKPRGRHKSPEREDVKRPKDPPWITLVHEVEPKKRAAPPPPTAVVSKHDDAEKSFNVSEEAVGQSSSNPKHYNPFEENEEQEPNENTLKPNHPWYGITPTSSPKASKKKTAPKGPNASPLACHSGVLVSRLSHSEPPSGSPSPALSTESLPTESSTKDHDSENVPKSHSEPTIHSPTTSGLPDERNTDFINHSTANSHDASNLSNNTSLASSINLTNTNEVQGGISPDKNNSSSGSLQIDPSRSAVCTPEPDSGAPSAEAKHPAKAMCKENPFNRKASPVTSPMDRKSQKGPAHRPAPGHGFPLIKRKVQADDYIPEHEILMEMEEIELRLDELERRGVELEHRLRKLENESEEDSLLVDWFKLIQEKHALVRRESELVYTTKQQDLEQRQADVEYELRCLLNKPEKDWLDEDKEREQVLMQELVTLIEQRNAIVKSLDEDKQREEEEDKLIEAMIQKKDFHADLQKKKKGKFKSIKALKLLSPKQDTKSTPKQDTKSTPKQDTKSKRPKDKKQEKGEGGKR